ncbi:hypothetical protein FRC19_002810 [Serendipita sp. 401]|nr:hypothetical protein FRC15_004389 [Serendipita sp. 397]KAG8812909.1 hypothetical protein FRC19_002810 [Serendipita sp. 401]KAG8844132.1 hypothetical protein FRC20_003622 [Serendipita sp. 405]
METVIPTSSHMKARFQTVILPCNPSSIVFPPSVSQPTITDPSTSSALQTASEHIRSSHLVVFPTETVYGLAANALSSNATADIFRTKGRPQDNPLIVHISSLEMLKLVVDETFVIPKTYEVLMNRFWPGPLTLLFPVKTAGDGEEKGGGGGVPKEVTAGHSTVAVRMPSHPVARALIAISGLPLAAPSANTSGRPSPTKAEHVYHDLNGRVGYILDGGPCDVGVESTVVDGLGVGKRVEEEEEECVIRVLRPGGVTVEEMQAVLGKGIKVLVHRRDYRDEQLENQPTTPGMKYRHYSPTCPVYLVMSGRQSTHTHSTEQISLDVFLRDVSEELTAESVGGEKESLRIGLLSLTGSRLTRALSEQRRPQVQTSTGSIHLDWVHLPLGSTYNGDNDQGEEEEDLSEPARRLFDGLISLDRAKVDAIVVEGVAEEREGLAFMNRVRKAAGKICSVALPD